jgi:hypothetical protein
MLIVITVPFRGVALFELGNRSLAYAPKVSAKSGGYNVLLTSAHPYRYSILWMASNGTTSPCPSKHVLV